MQESVFLMSHRPTELKLSLLVLIITIKELMLPLPCLNINQRASSALSVISNSLEQFLQSSFVLSPQRC